MDTIDSALPVCNSDWYDTWDRKTGQSFANAAKGLQNAPGENNCFMNSAVQVFWHIDVFRRSYRRLTGHLCMGHSCIFCALKVIFTQFQYSDQSSLQPSVLRKALATTFATQERFQLGHMDDAAECFENILNRIHYHIANQYNEDKCAAPHCIPHQKFAMAISDQLVCPCGAQSEPLKFYEMVHYISANALVSQSRTMQETGDVLHPSRFGLLLRSAGAVGNVRDCPGNCGKRVQLRKTLLNVPDVVSIGLVWGSDKADPDLTAEVTRTIGTMILLPDMFHSVMCNNANALPRLHLTAVVCYYGKHYSTFIYHTKLQEWIYFDDATVRQVGPHWEQVVERVARSRYQPLLLIYTNPNASSVPTETAPNSRVMAPGYSMNQAKDSKEDAKKPSVPEKSHTSTSKRCTTPRMEGGVSSHPDKEALEKSSSFEHRRQSSFMLAVTKPKNRDEDIYAVPHNNSKVMNCQRDLSRQDSRQGYIKHSQSAGQIGDRVDGNGDVYNYTLSNSDHHRRPSLNSPDHNKLPLTPNFSRNGEVQGQRKDSFKKGKVQADVIRFQVDAAKRNSQSSESDMNSDCQGSVNSNSSSKPSLPAKPKHFRTRSQSLEDNLGGMADGGMNTGTSSHKVIKPQATSAPVFNNIDSVTRAHTPVQSGLATLPRHKKHGNVISSSKVNTSSSSSSTVAHGQHTMGPNPHPPYVMEEPPPPYTPVGQSAYTSCLTYQNVVENDMHTRQGSNSSILSSGTIVECPINEDGSSTHNRQQSTTSQDTLTDKPKKPKGRGEKKEDIQKKTEKKVKSKKERSSKGTSDKPPPVPDKKSAKDEGFSEEKLGYIDRRMVESVLSFQKLQRSGSCVSQTSNSSLDSDSYKVGHGPTPRDNLSSDVPFDAASLDSHKDSGYGSSDRNSSSSTGSITMNPYEQYFLSRNMIPPKTLNQQAMHENMQKLLSDGPSMAGLGCTREKDLMSVLPGPGDFAQTGYTVGRVQQHGAPRGLPGQHPHDLNTLPNAYGEPHWERGKAAPPNKLGPDIRGNTVHGPRPGVNGHPQNQIFQNGPGHHVQQQQQQQQGNALKGVGQQPMPTLPEGVSPDSEQFIGLCQRAEEIMDDCVLAETSQHYGDAVGQCQHAIDLLKQAMRLPNIGQTSYNYAQKKSNACVIKLRSLQKWLNNSTNSSDGGATTDYRSRQHKSQGQGRPSSGTGSQNSMDSVSTSSSGRSNTPVFDKVMRPSTDERVPPVDPHLPHGDYQINANKDRSFETGIPDTSSASNPNNADLYGTLPRRKTKKSPDHVRQCNNQKNEAEVYQDFLDGQRRQSGGHSRSSSGARTPVNELNDNGDLNHSGQTVQYDNSDNKQMHLAPSNYQTGPQQSDASAFGRHFTEQGMSFTYSRMSQGLKPIPVSPPKIENQSKHTESQPDLRAMARDGANVPQRPLTPQVLCPQEGGEGETQPLVSVRDLKSRFESTRINDTQDWSSDSQGKAVNGSGSSGSNSNVGHVRPETTAPLQKPQVAFQRQRSKSESESKAQMPQKPKSVLAKKNKGGDRLSKPRKSVTFNTSVCLVEATGEWNSIHGDHDNDVDTESERRGMHDDTDSTSSGSPVVGDLACILCHKQGVEAGQAYCPKCTYYMQKYTPT
ncbi:uncharacterized protein LOC128208776 isoform X2 [Mya arenaria]|uniref:uncharacterized protein LOC128208776 isoform X2 n=1 Tax=Mya arenaria TaxID=6604 RepID=UPI0022E8D6EE|nr:uncharacterized protein LOC128208776 isoform X2 [Mya arenaria]